MLMKEEFQNSTSDPESLTPQQFRTNCKLYSSDPLFQCPLTLDNFCPPEVFSAGTQLLNTFVRTGFVSSLQPGRLEAELRDSAEAETSLPSRLHSHHTLRSLTLLWLLPRSLFMFFPPPGKSFALLVVPQLECSLLSENFPRPTPPVPVPLTLL